MGAKHFTLYRHDIKHYIIVSINFEKLINILFRVNFIVSTLTLSEMSNFLLEIFLMLCLHRTIFYYDVVKEIYKFALNNLEFKKK